MSLVQLRNFTIDKERVRAPKAWAFFLRPIADFSAIFVVSGFVWLYVFQIIDVLVFFDFSFLQYRLIKGENMISMLLCERWVEILFVSLSFTNCVICWLLALFLFLYNALAVIHLSLRRVYTTAKRNFCQNDQSAVPWSIFVASFVHSWGKWHAIKAIKLRLNHNVYEFLPILIELGWLTVSKLWLNCFQFLAG